MTAPAATMLIAFALLSGGVAACSPRADAHGRETKAPRFANDVRVFLSPAQLTEARASGSVDKVRSLLNIDKRLRYGEFVWNEASVPPGPLWIRVDLGAQLISVFRGGDEIGTAVIVYGGAGKETPTGKQRILAKARDHRSSIYDGAPMPYTLRLTADGISIHGSHVRWGTATHGCIGVPLEFARRLFENAKVGDEVLIVGGQAAQT